MGPYWLLPGGKCIRILEPKMKCICIHGHKWILNNKLDSPYSIRIEKMYSDSGEVIVSQIHDYTSAIELCYASSVGHAFCPQTSTRGGILRGASGIMLTSVDKKACPTLLIGSIACIGFILLHLLECNCCCFCGCWSSHSMSIVQLCWNTWQLLMKSAQ